MENSVPQPTKEMSLKQNKASFPQVVKGYLSFFFLWWRLFYTLNSEAVHDVQSVTENDNKNKRKFERYYLISYFSFFFVF